MTHIEGRSRYQSSLLSPPLDEAVAADDPVRVIDAFVNSLDLAVLGFGKVVAAATGRPPYRPGDLLKLYVYGYLNRVRSSRLLAREARRNLEVLWLIEQVTPSFKTIADFRRDHAAAIVAVCRAFVGFCRRQSLFGGDLLAIDGTRIEAVASRKQVLTRKELAKQLAAIDRQIADYLTAMDAADRRDDAAGPADGGDGDVAAALAALKTQRDAVRRQAEALVAEGLAQRVIGEPEARLMRTARHGHQVAYNAQSVVDARHGLIVAIDLTSDGNDLSQLHPMAVAGLQATGAARPTVVADAGYSNGVHAQQCAAAGITPVVPRPRMINPKGAALFTRDAFAYDHEANTYRCPAGETMLPRDHSPTAVRIRYTATACQVCPLKPQCTEAAYRTVVRQRDEDARQAMHRRAIDDPGWMKQRRCLVEHPFGTIKWLMGTPRFLLRGIEKAKAEFALLALAFNIKRTIAIKGSQALIAALQNAHA